MHGHRSRCVHCMALLMLILPSFCSKFPVNLRDIGAIDFKLRPAFGLPELSCLAHVRLAAKPDHWGSVETFLQTFALGGLKFLLMYVISSSGISLSVNHGSAHWTGLNVASTQPCLPRPAGHEEVFSRAPPCNAATHQSWHHSTAWVGTCGSVTCLSSPRLSPSVPTSAAAFPSCRWKVIVLSIIDLFRCKFYNI